MFTYALPAGYDYNVKTFTRQVKTKKWVTTYKKELINTADRLTNSKRDNRQILGGMLQTAFGVNIGRQIETALTDKDLEKMRTNIIQIIYA